MSLSSPLPPCLSTNPARNKAMGLNAATRLMGGYASLRTSSTGSDSGDLSDDKDSPLLPKGEEDLDTVPLHRLHHKRKISWARRHPFLVHGVLLILNLLVAISYGFWSFSSCVVDPAHRYCMFHPLPLFLHNLKPRWIRDKYSPSHSRRPQRDPLRRKGLRAGRHLPRRRHGQPQEANPLQRPAAAGAGQGLG